MDTNLYALETRLGTGLGALGQWLRGQPALVADGQP
jgi:hypothetical protein